MAQIVYSQNTVRDLERTFAFLLEHDPQAASASVTAIREAIDLLARHPFIGPRIAGELRQLIVSFGKTGYVALYRFLPAREEIRILAIRQQRELDYPE